MHLSIDLHIDLVEVLPSLRHLANAVNPSPADLGGEQRTKPVLPEPHRLVADVDSARGQQVLDVSQGYVWPRTRA